MADLVGSFIQAEVNRRSQERSFEQQRQLQADAQAYNTLMFNSSNAYNSPVNQMSRFKAAGLNPNLIYGQMANISSPIGMSSPSSPSPASIQAPSLLESAQIGLIDAQKENIQADTKEKEQNIEESGSRIAKMEAEIDKIGHDNNWTDQQIEQSKATIRQIDKNIEFMDVNKDVLRQSIQNMMSEKNLTDQQVIAQQIDNFWADKRNKATINELLSRTHLNNAQAKEILELLIYKQSNLSANTAYLNAQTDRLYKLLPYEVVKFINEADQSGALYELSQAQAEQEKIMSDWAREHPRAHHFWNTAAPQLIGTLGNVAVGLISAMIIRGGMKPKSVVTPTQGAKATSDALEGVYNNPNVNY